LHELERARSILDEFRSRNDADALDDLRSGSAEAWVDFCLEIDPERAYSLCKSELTRLPASVSLWRKLSQVSAQTDRFDEAIVAGETAVRMLPDPDTASSLALLAARRGDPIEAVRARVEEAKLFSSDPAGGTVGSRSPPRARYCKATAPRWAKRSACSRSSGRRATRPRARKSTPDRIALRPGAVPPRRSGRPHHGARRAARRRTARARRDAPQSAQRHGEHGALHRLISGARERKTFALAAPRPSCRSGSVEQRSRRGSVRSRLR
jgi:hypothetical protein